MHTKGKWKLRKGDYPEVIVTSKETIVDYWNMKEANAKHIVKCVNNHDKLVEALEDIRNRLSQLVMPSILEVILLRITKQVLKECE